MLLKIFFNCLWVFSIAGSNKTGMKKVFYFVRMIKIFIIKSSSNLDNKELFPVYGSSYFKVWNSSDSNTEEKKGILILVIQRLLIQIC